MMYGKQEGHMLCQRSLLLVVLRMPPWAREPARGSLFGGTSSRLLSWRCDHVLP